MSGLVDEFLSNESIVVPDLRRALLLSRDLRLTLHFSLLLAIRARRLEAFILQKLGIGGPDPESNRYLVRRIIALVVQRRLHLKLQLIRHVHERCLWSRYPLGHGFLTLMISSDQLP